MKKSRIKFIKELHEESDEAWKEAIEKEFPKIFKKEGFKVGDWVTVKEKGFYSWRNDTVRISRIEMGRTWSFNDLSNQKEEFVNNPDEVYRKATPKEIKKALIKEAERRGFKSGVHVKETRNGSKSVFRKIFHYYHGNDHLNFVGSYDEVRTIYVKGQWVLEIVPTMTKEEAEEKLNVKII